MVGSPLDGGYTSSRDRNLLTFGFLSRKNSPPSSGPTMKEIEDSNGRCVTSFFSFEWRVNRRSIQMKKKDPSALESSHGG